MAIEYTERQLKRIHSLRQAKRGVFYKGQDGTLYIGTKEGALKREIALSGDTEGTSLNSSVEMVGGVSSSELIERLEKVEETLPEKVDDEDFESYKKENKCFTIAMAVAL